MEFNKGRVWDHSVYFLGRGPAESPSLPLRPPTHTSPRGFGFAVQRGGRAGSAARSTPVLLSAPPAQDLARAGQVRRVIPLGPPPGPPPGSLQEEPEENTLPKAAGGKPGSDALSPRQPSHPFTDTDPPRPPFRPLGVLAPPLPPRTLGPPTTRGHAHRPSAHHQSAHRSHLPACGPLGPHSPVHTVPPHQPSCWHYSASHPPRPPRSVLHLTALVPTALLVPTKRKLLGDPLRAALYPELWKSSWSLNTPSSFREAPNFLTWPSVTYCSLAFSGGTLMQHPPPLPHPQGS